MYIQEKTNTSPLRIPCTLMPQITRAGIRGTQVMSSNNKKRMSLSRNLDGAYFNETPPS